MCVAYDTAPLHHCSKLHPQHIHHSATQCESHNDDKRTLQAAHVRIPNPFHAKEFRHLARLESRVITHGKVRRCGVVGDLGKFFELRIYDRCPGVVDAHETAEGLGIGLASVKTCQSAVMMAMSVRGSRACRLISFLPFAFEFGDCHRGVDRTRRFRGSETPCR